MKDKTIPPCLITIDKEGRWYHKGAEMVQRDVIRLFYEHLELEDSGKHIIRWQGDGCYLDVEDTPFVIRRITPMDKNVARRFKPQ